MAFSFGNAFTTPTAAFGAAPAPAFGAAAAPATPFGASAGPAASSPFTLNALAPSPFGAPAFGTAMTTPGQPTAPAFGAAQPAFGQAAPAFGQAAQPAFGAAPAQPTFGAAPTQLAFGAAPAQPAFGAAPAQPSFGAAAQPALSKAALAARTKYVAVQSQDGKGDTARYASTAAQPEYEGVSFEEARWEMHPRNPAATQAQAAPATPAAGFGQPAFGAPAPAPAAGGFGFGAPAPAPAPAAGGFGFGAPAPAPAPAAGGFGFGAPAPAPAPAAGGFGFGAPAPAPAPAAGGFGFGAPAPAPAPAAGGFGFGAPAPAPAPAAGGFGFGAPAPAPAPAAGGFGFGAPAPAPAPAAGGFGFGAPAPAPAPAAGGFGFGAPAPAPAPAAGGFGFGAPAAAPAPAASGGFSFGAPAPAPAPVAAPAPAPAAAGGFSFGAPAPAPAPVAAPAPAPAAAGGFSFGALAPAPAPVAAPAPAPAAAGGFSFGTPAPAAAPVAAPAPAPAAAGGFSFGAPAPAAAPVAAPAPAPAAAGGFSFGALAPAAAPVAAPAPAPAAAGGFSFGAPAPVPGPAPASEPATTVPAPAPAAAVGFGFGSFLGVPAPEPAPAQGALGASTSSGILLPPLPARGTGSVLAPETRSLLERNRPEIFKSIGASVVPVALSSSGAGAGVATGRAFASPIGKGLSALGPSLLDQIASTTPPQAGQGFGSFGQAALGMHMGKGTVSFAPQASVAPALPEAWAGALERYLPGQGGLGDSTVGYSSPLPLGQSTVGGRLAFAGRTPRPATTLAGHTPYRQAVGPGLARGLTPQSMHLDLSTVGTVGQGSMLGTSGLGFSGLYCSSGDLAASGMGAGAGAYAAPQAPLSASKRLPEFRPYGQAPLSSGLAMSPTSVNTALNAGLGRAAVLGGQAHGRPAYSTGYGPYRPHQPICGSCRHQGTVDPDIPSPAGHLHVLVEFPALPCPLWLCLLEEDVASPSATAGALVQEAYGTVVDYLAYHESRGEEEAGALLRQVQRLVSHPEEDSWGGAAPGPCLASIRLVIDNTARDATSQLRYYRGRELVDRGRLSLIHMPVHHASSRRSMGPGAGPSMPRSARRRSVSRARERRASLSVPSMGQPGSPVGSSDVSSGVPAGLYSLLSEGQEPPVPGHLVPRLGALAEQGYVMQPPERELRLMSERQLACVMDFGLLRPGHGSVLWPGETDLRGLNVEGTVRIESGDILVYRQGEGPGQDANGLTEPKPAVGHGLNKRAILSLFNITPEAWAAEGAVGLTGGPDALEDLLRQHSLAMGAIFRGYDPVQGVWQFEVDHM